ncbi:MAG: NAD-dependent DNA ligase LigA, partial [Cellulosilyticum sp.]|nr:NAD-dependent DNA ligase LigA [Cellulosilyticum sp.]
MERMKELVELLSKAAYAYEQEDREIMSNLEYDALYDELKQLEEATGTILAGSVTQKVGYEIASSLPKVTHPKRMLSLDKTKEVERLKSFLGNQEGLLSWKLDGLTIVCTYEEGKLVSAVTRGNGQVGEEVTNNARTFKNLPLTIDTKERLVLRGEAIITYDDFNQINESLGEGEEKYKNPRNLCSGSVRQLNPAITAKRNVR